MFHPSGRQSILCIRTASSGMPQFLYVTLISDITEATVAPNIGVREFLSDTVNISYRITLL